MSTAENGQRVDSAQPPENPRPSTPAGSWLPLAVGVVAVLIAGFTWMRTTSEIRQLRQEVASLASSGSAAMRQIDVSTAPARGRDDAVVTLVEFSDYECPFCIRHFQQTMPKIEANYIATGKIRYVFRDFPIDQLHPDAIRAHEAARCAMEQGKFWNLHMQLFSSPGTHAAAAIDQRASSVGLDMTAFHGCLSSGRVTSGIRDSVALASKLGADGTPAFFVGLRNPQTEKVQLVRALTGAQPYERFAEALDEVIAETRNR